ncbi:MAG: type II toxin-antitoxin system RelE/ParE family toxin [Eubacteriales bacterium]|nr:type II toxin-antitoxin system RelE/ParE family toxin [Eubacteriales bacterium]
MKYRVQFTDTAREDLRALAFHIAEVSGDKELAKRFVRELQKSCEILETYPESGALPRDRVLKSAGYRFLVYKEYLTFYTVDKERSVVTVLAVFNGRKDYMRVMKRFL